MPNYLSYNQNFCTYPPIFDPKECSGVWNNMIKPIFHPLGGFWEISRFSHLNPMLNFEYCVLAELGTNLEKMMFFSVFMIFRNFLALVLINLKKKVS